MEFFALHDGHGRGVDRTVAGRGSLDGVRRGGAGMHGMGTAGWVVCGQVVV